MTAEQSFTQPIASSPSRAGRSYRPLSLRRNFAWTLAGTAVYGASQWGMLILLAKLGGPEIQGRFALGLALAAPVIMFTNMQLRLVQATDARHEYAFRDYLSLRLVASGAALLVIAALALFGHYRAEVVAVLVLVGLAKAIESISDVIWGLWQKAERLDLIAISMMIKGPASLLAMWLLLWWSRSLLLTTLGLAVTWLVLLLTYDLAFARRLLPYQPAGPRPALRFPAVRLARLALPLGVVGLLDSLDVNLPRYFLERHLGEAALGYFAAMAYIMVAGNLVVVALAQSASARLSRSFVSDRPRFLRLMLRLLALGAALGLAGVLLAVWFGRPLLSFLYRSDYGDYAGVLVWTMVAAAFGYLARFLITGISAARFFRAQTPLYACSLLVAAVGSWWLIPLRGLTGAAWALAAALLTLLFGAALIFWLALRCPSGSLPSGPAADALGAAHDA